KIIKDIQAHLPGTDIMRGDNIKDIIDTISSAKSARLTADDLKIVAKQNLEDSKAISDFASLYLKQIVPRDYRNSLNNAYLPILNELKKFENIPPILKGVERSIKLLINDLEKAVDEASVTEKITPLSGWKDAYFEKDEHGNYRLKDRIANKKLASLANIMEQYEARLRRDGLYDFDDMIEEAVRVLKEDEGFRLTLSERYQFILLDEFQDTNPSQFEIIKQITDYEKPLIMAVG
ncbi:UvrD-helicase domain-containing protein, partial [Ralstonia pseudosolanacearum]|uniref:UvrD-helicase domain-containing protein n=1 Tax=Ralstonia pseudosolanacearum TaxID=1310165 RepID=UPI003D1624C0